MCIWVGQRGEIVPCRWHGDDRPASHRPDTEGANSMVELGTERRKVLEDSNLCLLRPILDKFQASY